MSNNYLNINPIAKQFSIETLRIFENESVEELIQKLSTSLLLQAAGDQLCDMLLKVVTGFAFKSAFGKSMPAAKHKADHGVGGDASIGDFIALCLSNA